MCFKKFWPRPQRNDDHWKHTNLTNINYCPKRDAFIEKKEPFKLYFSKMTLFVKSIWYLPLSKRKKHVGCWWDKSIQTHEDTSCNTETCEVRRSGDQKKKMKTGSKTIKRVISLKASTKLCLQVKVKEKKGSEKRQFCWLSPSWTPEKQVEVKRCFRRKIFKEKTITYSSLINCPPFLSPSSLFEINRKYILAST